MATYTDGLTAADSDSKEEIFRQFQITKKDWTQSARVHLKE